MIIILEILLYSLNFAGIIHMLNVLGKDDQEAVLSGIRTCSKYYTGSHRLPTSLHQAAESSIRVLWGRLKAAISRVLPILLEKRAEDGYVDLQG